MKLLFVGHAHYVRGGKDTAYNKIFTQGALELSLFPNKGNLLEIWKIADAQRAFAEFFIKGPICEYPYNIMRGNYTPGYGYLPYLGPLPPLPANSFDKRSPWNKTGEV